MLSVNQPGSEVWLSRADKATRTLAYTWELIRVGHALVGINTGRPNRLVAEALARDRIPELVRLYFGAPRGPLRPQFAGSICCWSRRAAPHVSSKSRM